MSNLSNIEILRKMRKAHPYSKTIFLNVFSRDNLPDSIPFYPCSLIINTDTNNLPGKHWIAVYINRYKVAEYFDSLNQPRLHDIALWMNRFSWTVRKVTSFPLQSNTSLMCGGYVLYFVNERPLKNNCKSALELFSKNCDKNDVILTKYVETVLK